MRFVKTENLAWPWLGLGQQGGQGERKRRHIQNVIAMGNCTLCLHNLFSIQLTIAACQYIQLYFSNFVLKVLECLTRYCRPNKISKPDDNVFALSSAKHGLLRLISFNFPLFQSVLSFLISIRSLTVQMCSDCLKDKQDSSPVSPQMF